MINFADIGICSNPKRFASLRSPRAQSVLSAQFETTPDFGSLLRANTPVSRMMTTYTRRGPGQAYLKRVLAGKINALMEGKEVNLEVNPLKVGLELREGAGVIPSACDDDRC